MRRWVGGVYDTATAARGNSVSLCVEEEFSRQRRASMFVHFRAELIGRATTPSATVVRTEALGLSEWSATSYGRFVARSIFLALGRKRPRYYVRRVDKDSSVIGVRGWCVLSGCCLWERDMV
jgi:hypothetical protein